MRSLVAVLIIFHLFIAFIPVQSFAAGKVDFCVFDSKVDTNQKGCAKDMDIEVREIKRDRNLSVVRVKAKKRGTYAGAIMFQVCSFSRIAKSRGYRYWVSLGVSDIPGCDTCEWYQEHTIGFLKSRTEDVRHVFARHDKQSQSYDIEDINDGALLVCGFLPIPNLPLHKLASQGNLTMLVLHKLTPGLVNKIDSDGFAPLHYAAGEGHIGVAAFLSASGADKNLKGFFGFTPLHLAVLLENTTMVETLLSLGTDPNSVCDDGVTPLCYAAHIGGLRTAELLIQNGAEIDRESEMGNTALHIAVAAGQLEMVKYLLNAGADSLKKNGFNETALMLAQKRDNKEIVDALSKHKK